MKSILFKLWSGMMSMVLVVLILLWLFQTVFLESFYTNIRISDTKKESSAITRLYDSGDKSEFENKMDEFAYNNNLSVELMDLNQKTVYIAGQTGINGQMPMMKNNSRNDAFQAAISGQEVSIPLTHPRFGNKFMLIGIPVLTSGKISGALIINMPIAPVEDTASILKRQLFFITFILLAAALLISYRISRSFTRPILEIKKASEKMASGDFTSSVKIKNHDEIGRLADTINNLGQQLSKIEQFRKDFIANVSHELRTPLSLIRGYSETIRDITGNSPEKREKQLGIIIDETERLSRIVDDILNLSQLQSGYSKLDKSNFLVRESLDSVVSHYGVLTEKAGVQIIQQYSVDTMVEADKNRIEQVLYNLINNGLNHTPEGGTITVKAIDNLGTVRIEVSDTGSGIPGEDIPHIWDRYYKAKKTSIRGVSGTGLGLAIVKSVLEAHGSAFGVESQKDAGTTFWFELKKVLL